MMDAFRGSGRLFNASRLGSPVDRASEAKMSMIRFSHSSWMTAKIDESGPATRAETIVKTAAVMLIVSWN